VSAVIVFFLPLTGCAAPRGETFPARSLVPVASVTPALASPVATTLPAPREFHLHLNGIGGYRGVDRGMIRGLRDGGYAGEVKAYDWTGDDVGLAALTVKRRHKEQSAAIAQILIDQARAHPGSRITITTHSAGAGIIVWALAQLPRDITIDTLVFLAPALSPTYDLTPALRHVSGKAYVFYSPYDAAVLGMGTTMFGTVDGVKTEASGKVGFQRPATADAEQYAKIVQFPYRTSWVKLGNIGDHIGVMRRAFAREVLAPLLVRGSVTPRLGGGNVDDDDVDDDSLMTPPAFETVPATNPSAGHPASATPAPVP
ncbi:MAG: hypothetical protein ABIP55_05310, partial [Tepidisphaeraceae bacterium]